MFAWEKLKHFAVTLWISIGMKWIQWSTQKNASSGERRAELWRSWRRQQFIIKVSSWRFYNQQEVLINNNACQKADNKHTGNMIFPFFLLVSKIDKPLGDDTYQSQSVKLICWQAFSFIRFFNGLFLFPFQAEIFDAFINSNDEFP